jgi:starch synthase (maltosyl-transferring)
LWGIFSGFELCEAAAVPNREEYLNSDKYEIRARNWQIPGNISAEITDLNRARRTEPALQSHLGTTFYNAFNEHVLYFGRHAEGHSHRVLVLVNLNPRQDQTSDFELPLWEWDLPDSASVDVRDLISGDRFQWHGKIQHLTIPASMPYRIFRITPAHGRQT